MVLMAIASIESSELRRQKKKKARVVGKEGEDPVFVPLDEWKIALAKRPNA